MRWLRQLQTLWEPAPRMGGAEWADTYRVLGPDESAQPGPWRTLPWQRFILDLIADPSVDWIVVLKAAQMGVSELIRCAIGRWALLDPGPVLWVMSDEKPARKTMAKLRLMFANTPALQHLLPVGHQRTRKKKDSLCELVLTNGMRIVIGWATSASSLASDPFLRVILDETGLYPPKVGKEGSPVGLAEERTKTYGRRRKIIMLSKPAHPDDLICTEYDKVLDKRARHVPCPDCGHLQPLEWERSRWLDSEGGVMTPADAPRDPELRLLLATHIEESRAAWIECEACTGRIVDVQAADADPRADWLRVDGTEADTRRRALHVGEQLHWTRRISDLVARFLRATKPADLQNFWTGSLGLPYEEERGSLTQALFRNKAIHEPGTIPAWATAVIATADTQADCFWVLVRAWGRGWRTRLVDFFRVEAPEDEPPEVYLARLQEQALGARWPVEGTDRNAGAVGLGVDSGGGDAGGRLDGSRSQVVYQFARTTPNVWAFKGTGSKKASGEVTPITWAKIKFGEDKEQTVEIVQPHANHWKDQTATLCRSDRWEETTQATSTVYLRHMTGQRQVWEENAKGEGKWVWRKRRGRPDHLWDCSYMQTVAAEMLDVDQRPKLRDVAQKQARHEAQRRFTNDDEGNDWISPYMRSDSW